MKIAILCEIIDYKSGARAPIELAKRLAKNHQVHLFAYNYRTGTDAVKDLEKMDIQITLFPYFKPAFLARIIPIIRLFLILKGQHFDVISLHCFFPFLLAAKLSGIPTIRTYYGMQKDIRFESLSPEQPPNFTDKTINWFLNWLIYLREIVSFILIRNVVAISQYTQREIKSLFHRTVPYIYLGVDSSLIGKTFSSAKPKEVYFLAISRITPYKNFHLLIKAFQEVNKKISQSRLTIVGSAPNLKYLKYLKLLKGNSQKIKIFTDVSDSQLSRLYQQADVFLSADRFSFFGLPPLEAALFGLPTIALNYAALPEMIIHQKTGLLAKNQKEFVRYMISLASNPKRANKLGKMARNRVKKDFTWKDCASRYERLFLEIIR